ncbi:Aromatic hydrocarbon catabolism protein [Seminavis robusta]|uniref:Aromatic hydrocarbon catabolism protein n=1 Tax=Seminavis robusta TaxID=568900 RepID=A0A9N8HTG5_9STRA|nr:Aromatic hydrocarbon catabolism protein [Seminavis robusta]|eukprot:Sro1510_g278610.1 Aromatic hydrocarbon catabolism protein (303) ;mRNA; f:7760-8777
MKAMDYGSIATIRTCSDGTPIQLQYSIQEPSIDNDGDNVPVVVVLHASGGGHDQGLLLATKLLPPNRYRIISISWSGYLQSTAVSSVQEQCEDLQLLLQETLGIPKISLLLGMSVGSVMTLQFASLYPQLVESIVVLSPWIPYAGDDENSPQKPCLPAPPQWVLNVFFGSEFVKWSSIRVGFGNSMCGVTPATSNEAKQLVSVFLDTLFPVSDRFQGFCLDVQSAMSLRLTAQELSKITASILYVAAEDDPQCKIYENQLPASMVNSNQVTIMTRPTGGHIMVADYQKTQQDIQVFLDKKSQ